VNKYEQFEQDSINSTQARDAYARYLQSFNWDYFLTVTFRKDFRDGIKALDYVWDTLHYDCFAKRAFLSSEKHRYPSRDVHIHGLISDYDGSWRPNMCLPWEMWSIMFKRFGRSRVEAISRSEQVTAYCSKYVSKRLSEYGFFGAPTFWEK